MSFYTSLTGLNSAASQLAVTSNNIANVGTSGFKRSRADFGDIFSTSPLQKASGLIGQGVLLKQVSQEFSQGNISTSGNSLDLAITGDGFFPLKSPDGLQDIYTRNGSFSLNDQNNVVNSTGQRLMAASVDSSGKADLSRLTALTIPPKTSGQAKETRNLQLGLNLPADSPVLDISKFDRTNPNTYNKSTALTVYDSGGNGYLATVYYVRTQSASPASPFSKWQTMFYVGDTQVKPALQQATDSLGSTLYVNKYGEVAPKSDPRVVPSTGTTEMFTLDERTDIRSSIPATATGKALAPTFFNNGSFISTVDPVIAASPTLPLAGMPGYVALDVSDLSEGLEIRFTVTDGTEQTYTVTEGQDIDDVVEAINQLISSGVTASVGEDGKLVLTATDPSKGVVASYVVGGEEPVDGEATPAMLPTGGTATFSLSGLSTGDVLKFTLQGGTERSLTVNGNTASSLALAINGLVDAGVTASVNPEGELVLTAVDVTKGVTGSFTNKISNDIDGFAAGKTLSFDLQIDGAAVPQTISYTLTGADSDPDKLARNLETRINNFLGSLPNAADRRYGIGLQFDAVNKKFSVVSGTTGDGSSIEITASNDLSVNLLGFEPGLESLSIAASPNAAQRGQPSLPAVLFGESITSTSKTVSVSSGNKDLFVSVDGISRAVELPLGSYSLEDVAKKMEEAINGYTDPDTGRMVTGVKVTFDPKTKKLEFKTGTTGENASIQVSGSSDWGLANSEMKFGQTSEWIKMSQYKENGALQYVKNGKQTEDATDLSTKTTWWPIYLDRGELSFNLTGKTVSPLTTMKFETAFLEGGKGSLTMAIDFTQSAQYAGSFAVLSQSQDGAPEGELMGLNIGVDGLVSATYSNGSQSSLGKIVLANFSSPTGLRQVGDASYLASATSGIVKIGEAGSAGFGSIRAGATERSNVDLTQELVDLITAQRNFQANAKAIETSSTMTQAIVNIRA
jgi:flagellar hook-basal body protein